MMPQKKNPDVAELIRGKSARLIGHVTALYTLEKSLCFGYGRELQEDKEPIFQAIRDALLSLRALTGALATCTFNKARLQGALLEGNVCATDLADYLVLEGVPFREAHHIVGSLVRESEQKGVQISDLDPEILAKAHPALQDQRSRLALSPELAVERRQLVGGPAKARVLEQIAAARRLLES
jgi:argininosuccinate lyase